MSPTIVNGRSFAYAGNKPDALSSTTTSLLLVCVWLVYHPSGMVMQLVVYACAATQPSQTQPEADDEDGNSDEDGIDEDEPGPSQVTLIMSAHLPEPEHVPVLSITAAMQQAPSDLQHEPSLTLLDSSLTASAT